MEKLKEIAKETSTWTLGVPSLVFGILTLLKDDNAQAVTNTIKQAGEVYANSGDFVQGLGFLGMGLLGIFMKGR